MDKNMRPTRLILNPAHFGTFGSPEKGALVRLQPYLKPAFLGALMMIGNAEIALAQPAQQGFPPPMPETKGKVAQYSVTPRGDVDGLILVDGTEVLIPKHAPTRLVFFGPPW